MEKVLTILFLLIIGYLVLGALFSIALLSKGIQKIDDSAVGAGLGFKLIILPGVVLFWVFLIKQWLRRKS